MEETAGTSQRLSPANSKENVLPADCNVIPEENKEPDDGKEKQVEDEYDQNEEVSQLMLCVPLKLTLYNTFLCNQKSGRDQDYSRNASWGGRTSETEKSGGRGRRKEDKGKS